MFSRSLVTLLVASCSLLGSAQTGPALPQSSTADVARAQTERMAATAMRHWPAGVVSTTKKPGQWGYEEGVLLDGMLAEWTATGDERQFAYVQAAVDKYVRPDGTLQMDSSGRPYPTDAHTLDDVELGRSVLAVYRQTQAERYRKAAEFLHARLAGQPRNASGGFWHKTMYPNQMWLDGAYMAEPFRAEYAATFHENADWADIAHQFLLMDEHMRDRRTGLLLHGWDESKQMPWADRQTGLSPSVWARALGWYAMALADVLDWFPRDRPERAQLISVLRTVLTSVVRFQDRSTGLWWQVMDRPAQDGNFLEASASAMFCESIAKSVRLRYVAPSLGASAAQAWSGLQRRFVRPAADGTVVLTGTVKAAGLGGTPYRSGTFDYYIHEPVGDDDAKGVGAYLLAGSEMQQASSPHARN